MSDPSLEPTEPAGLPEDPESPPQAQLMVSPQQTVAPPAAGDGPRTRFVKWLLWGVEHEPQIHYAQIRPIPHTATLPLTTDCSGFVTLCAELAKVPDPNGRGYDGSGYTGTLLAHCTHVPFSEAREADLIVYGPFPGHHVCGITKPVRDRFGHVTDLHLVSHGQERGPLKILHSQEQRVQPTPAVVLRFISTTTK